MKRRIALAALIVVGLSYGFRGVQTRSVAFDRGLWMKQPDLQDTGNWRNRMASDVIHRLVRPGLTKAAVLAQLGEPDGQSTERLREQFVDPFPPGTASALRYVTYYGEWAGELNGDAIYVFFDREDRVVQALKGGMWS